MLMEGHGTELVDEEDPEFDTICLSGIFNPGPGMKALDEHTHSE